MTDRTDEQDIDRRPIASRQNRLIRSFVGLLLRTRITPNQISSIGILFAALGGAAFAFGPRAPWLFIAGALCVQLRLLCNLFDGMVAVEGGRGGPLGVLYNELPDRVEDSLLLIGFGYGTGWPELGFVAALLAVMTAYLRAVGASLGLDQDYGGWMAKPQRMAALTIGGIVAAAELWLGHVLLIAPAILGAVVIGTAITCFQRISRMARRLK